MVQEKKINFAPNAPVINIVVENDKKRPVNRKESLEEGSISEEELKELKDGK